MNQAKKSNVPTVCLLEDIDLVEDFKTNLHYVINILDGVDTPINTKGTYLILTTNYEKEIDPRALRFGRVDLKLQIGLLETKYAINLNISNDPRDCYIFSIHRNLFFDRTIL